MIFEESAKPLKRWSGRPDSNRRRPPWEGGILPLNYSRIQRLTSTVGSNGSIKHTRILPYAKAASNVFTAALFSSRSDCVYTSKDTPIPWPR